MASETGHMTYADAGVDIDEKSKAIGALVSKLKFRRTEGARSLDLPGQFTGIIDIGSSLLTLCTDGVGTKLLIAKQLEKWDTIGIDCVSMNTNDTICVGAEPIAFVDYMAVDVPDPETLSQIAIGLNKGCELSNCDLIGGEVAVLPELVREVDVSGSCLGMVEKDKLIDGSKVAPGDLIIGLPSTGLHSNGYTLARKILEKLEISLDEKIAGLNEPIGNVLLTPTEVYVRDVLKIVRKYDVHGMVNITGGGLRNFLRLKKGISTVITDPLPPNAIFNVLNKLGNVEPLEAYQTFNMGMGFSIIVPENCAAEVVKEFPGAKIVGEIRDGFGVSVPSLDLKYEKY
ncbi:phosphoribosylformylglycinamidine cyclo-ligase [Candidatus Methanomassiliicoccus intestinalis]|uniref:phosphoribosylformylglycinamidine cyclo-ligase n=2 Tax=Candidatus Methanomassiliicoccus intestinalis TaxID=1406512 RepID=UPI0037DD5730